jgi:hypothetical protein
MDTLVMGMLDIVNIVKMPDTVDVGIDDIGYRIPLMP